MPRKSTLILIVSLLVIAFGLSSIGRAQEGAPAGANAPAGSSFTYQGQLKDASGPVTSSCDFQLGLWDALTGGTQVGSTLTQSSVAVSEGLFTVQLDFGANAFDGNARWLEIAVCCPAGVGAYNPLAPRQPLTPAPYALYSANANLLDGQHAAAFANIAHDHWGQAWNGSGIGLTLTGDTGMVGNGQNIGVEGISPGLGVYGWTTTTVGGTIGVAGQSDATEGKGVYGWTTATTGMNYGVFGQSHSTDGRGVYGENYSTSGFGYGVEGITSSPNGAGVWGRNRQVTGPAYGVRGTSNSTSGMGVLGETWQGESFGVVGNTSSTTGTGVYGLAVSTSGASAGVWGKTDSPNGWGVYGQAACYNCNFGVLSNGNLYVTGNSTVVGTKSATVQTQNYGWVNLYSMESPRVLFEDVNTAQLINGQAEVAIDPVFAETVDLTQPYQVFLTPGGDCNLYVSSKTSTAFTVSAQGGQTCSISFDYRIIAVRKGYADLRLEQAEDPEQVTRHTIPATVPPDHK